MLFAFRKTELSIGVTILDIEIFVNSHCELTGGLAAEIRGAVESYGLNVVSIHPYTSFSESFVLFGNYPRRAADGLDYYKRFFDFSSSLGASYFVLHGAGLRRTADGEEYFERYARLDESAKRFGIRVAHENVVGHRGQSPQFLCALKRYLNDDLAVTLDIKQAVRAGEDPFRFIDSLEGSIVNVHISDHNGEADCLPPLEGSFDFARLFSRMSEAGYKGKYLIELYSDGYTDKKQLKDSAERLERIKERMALRQ